MSKKFSPCPHCGKTKPVRMAAASEDEGFDGSNADSYAVLCDASKWAGHDPGGCGAQSGYYETEDEAAAAWNRRAGIHVARTDGGIYDNPAAIAIVAAAVEQLQALGVNCLVSPVILPQGEAVALYVGGRVGDVIAADLACRRGADAARGESSAEKFGNDVAESLAEATISQAARSSSSQSISRK